MGGRFRDLKARALVYFCFYQEVRAIQVVYGGNEKGNLLSSISDHNAKEYFKPFKDVFMQGAALDIGTINCSPIDPSRKDILMAYSHSDLWEADGIEKHWAALQAMYSTFVKRARKGEAVRVWYSNAPFSLCGYYNTLYELNQYDCLVTAVKLPEWYLTEGRAFARRGQRALVQRRSGLL